jgi:hypothetical protein
MFRWNFTLIVAASPRCHKCRAYSDWSEVDVPSRPLRLVLVPDDGALQV